MIALDLLNVTLQRHVALGVPDGMPVVLPGRALDAETTAEWIELACDTVDGVPQRDTPAELREITVTLQVFVRNSTHTARIQELAEAARGLINGRLIEIVDRTLSDEPVIGAMRFREADVRDLTRVHAAHQRRPLRHIVVTARGLVQAFL